MATVQEIDQQISRLKQEMESAENLKPLYSQIAKLEAEKKSLVSGPTVTIDVPVPRDDSLWQNLTDGHVARALAARQRGESVVLGGGRDGWNETQTNAVLDYMLANNMPATKDGLGTAQVPSGQFTKSSFGLGGLVSDLAPYAKMLAATAGAAYLGGGALGASNGTGAAAAVPSQYSLAGMGTGTTGGLGATGTGFGTSALTAASPGVAVGSGIGGGMGAAATGGALSSLASPELVSAAQTLAQKGITQEVLQQASTNPSIMEQITAATGLSGNTLGSLISGGASLWGASQSAGSAADAAAIQKQASDAALAEQKRQFDLGQEAQMPWRTAGQTALTEQTNLMGLGAQGAEGQLASLMKSPGYEFRLSEGTKALDRSASARGGVFSGAAGKALTKFGQDYGSNEYGNRLSQLSSLSGQGQAAASGMAGQGTNYANNTSNLLTNMGNAGAASSITQGNAWQSGIQGAGNALSSLFNPPKAQPTFQLDPATGQYVYR